LITGYWGSMALFTANELGVFTALASSPRTSDKLAADLGVSERPLRMLLQAMAGLGLLRACGEEFANTPLADAFLVEGHPGSLGRAIRYGADHYAAWGQLTQVVSTGRPPAGVDAYLGADPERTRHFVWGMHERALGVARGIIPFIDLPRATTLLDLGGGPGTYSVLLAQKVADLRAIVFDLPPVVAIAGDIIAASGVADRVRVHAGDYLRDSYPRGVGAVLISGVLHRETESTCRAMLAEVREALVPGGRVIISDVMLDAEKTGPPFATLFALHMLLTSERGGAHSKEEQRRWLEDAGFVSPEVRELPPPAVHTLITATKP
jgi:hypothetical protein